VDKVLQTALELAEQGVAVHFLKPRSKAPLDDGWSTAPVNDPDRLERIYREGMNVGVRLGKFSKIGDRYLHVIDMDVRKPGAEKAARAKLIELFGEAAVSEFVPVQSGSGGASRHFYFLTDQPFRSRKFATSGEKFLGDDGRKHWTWELELFGTGKQVAAPPSIHPDTGKRYRWEADRPLASARVVKSAKLAEIVGRSVESDGSGDSSGLEYLTGRLDWPERKIRKVLKTLDHDSWCDDYDGWLKVGMALHHETGGSKDGLELWHDFSEASEKYDPDELDKRWKGFGRASGDPIRFISMVYEAGLDHMVKLTDGIETLTEELLDELEELDDDNHGIRALPEASLPDEHEIKPRPWVLKPFYLSQQIGVTVAPGGVGKSTLTVAEAVGLASGRQTIGGEPERPYTVWHWNLEDPEDELARRFAAARKHYGITRDDYAGRLFVNGAEDRLVIGTDGKDGVRIFKPIVKALIRECKRLGVEVLQVDPFISSHQVSENDNMAVQAIVDAWRLVAREANVAVHLVHHTRKAASGASGERTADDSRGAGALNAAARMVRVLNPMSKDEAEKLCIDTPWKYVRMDNGKANFAPPTEKADWFQLENVELTGLELDHIEDVGVATPWEPVERVLDSFEDQDRVRAEIGADKWRVDQRSPEWIGLPVGRALGLLPEDPKDLKEIKARITFWMKSGFLKKVTAKDHQRKLREFIVIGEIASRAKPSIEDLIG